MVVIKISSSSSLRRNRNQVVHQTTPVCPPLSSRLQFFTPKLFCAVIIPDPSAIQPLVLIPLELLLKLAVLLYIITLTTAFDRNSKISVICSTQRFLSFHHQSGQTPFCTSILMQKESHYNIKIRNVFRFKYFCTS